MVLQTKLLPHLATWPAPGPAVEEGRLVACLELIFCLELVFCGEEENFIGGFRASAASAVPGIAVVFSFAVGWVAILFVCRSSLLSWSGTPPAARFVLGLVAETAPGVRDPLAGLGTNTFSCSPKAES